MNFILTPTDVDVMQNFHLNKKTYLQAVIQKRQTVLAKLELPHFIKNSLCAELAGYSQVQEIVLRKMRCTHSNIWFELFWNSVVNTT